jgi:hypothetical protein
VEHSLQNTLPKITTIRERILQATSSRIRSAEIKAFYLQRLPPPPNHHLRPRPPEHRDNEEELRQAPDPAHGTWSKPHGMKPLHSIKPQTGISPNPSTTTTIGTGILKYSQAKPATTQRAAKFSIEMVLHF